MNIKKVLFFFLLAEFSSHCLSGGTLPILLLQTFGSPQQAGRNIGGQSERNITQQLADEISTQLQEETTLETFIINPPVRAKKDPLEILGKINSMPKATVIQLSVSQTTTPKPVCNVFYRCYNPLTDQIKRPSAGITAIPLEEVYLLSFNQSKALAASLTTYLQQENHEAYEIRPAAGIPLANARGIRHPLIHIEIEVDKTTPLLSLSTSLAKSLKLLLSS